MQNALFRGLDGLPYARPDLELPTINGWPVPYVLANQIENLSINVAAYPVQPAQQDSPLNEVYLLVGIVVGAMAIVKAARR